jgi:hypothetical protein
VHARSIVVLSTLLALACRQHSLSNTNPYDDVARYGDAAGQRGGSHGIVPQIDSLDIRQRADSLAALDPEREARGAIARGDLRYLAVCRIVCTAIGIHPDSLCLLGRCESERRYAVRPIEGMEQATITPDIAHLDSIAQLYGKRYNSVLHDFRVRSARRLPQAAHRAHHRTRHRPQPSVRRA